jgi:UDP-2-acetamido-3-amino-2,3-dideoxy-glucuronate N-acetyltransferase
MSEYGEKIPLPLQGEEVYVCPHTGVSYELQGSELKRA